ncbi:ABC transporter ATP-binding protein [Actinobacteria bacterium YIM 96077]|uniref:Cobalamin/Fe(3+)-siderophore ABC transporter ATP-binding protein n=1 Tax=Phytoactinopolyspora halophila TaxID=1981511 RepID=A0A329QYT4_9ACTN|nr:ABC transporter ATP-binding protein [Phytoactinopolyspora halophila]AYY13211.1 ABC transporter ATP-binding protein [Actinobacteria bacterium YIM 96077]RAW17550.1 cobalamin/Fe(3+)-siderophore ABC transporter ATP-binding protein [Phytoactinopolyspora halophila]
MHALRAENLSLAYDKAAVIEDLTVSLPEGKITALVGPNGCGKSTLLRGLARLLKPERGAIYLDGREISRLPSKKLAQRLGLLPQSPSAPDGLLVLDLVGRGRYPHQSWLDQWSREDELAVEKALELTGASELRHRVVDELSGGQRQRVWIAMALAQQTGTLLLDEPTTFLDIAYQVEVMELLHQLYEDEGRTIVVVLHDLNQACRYAHHLVALSEGRVVARGAPTEIVDETLVRDVFALDCQIIDDPVAHTPLVVPLGRKAAPVSASAS